MTRFDINNFVEQVLKEDIGRGDVFSWFNINHHSTAKILAKENGILSGQVYAHALAELCNVVVHWHKTDCESFNNGDIIATLEGGFSDILLIERSFLNILQHSSGIARLCADYLKALGDSKIRLLDTRKTRPLLRVFEKYSVRNGGGCNHRFGLDDCVMIKDTHRAQLGDLKNIIKRLRQSCWTLLIEVESETFDEFCEAIECGADIVMCDNMDIDMIKKCIAYRNEHAPNIRIELSGGITLENIAQYKHLGIDAISIGSIIHHAVFVDMSMKIQRL